MAEPDRIEWGEVYLYPYEPFPREMQDAVVDLDKLEESDQARSISH